MWSKILFIGIIVLTFFSTGSPISIKQNNFLTTKPAHHPSLINEKILSETENAYNPIPSPDGKMIAYVETGWDRWEFTSGLGRSNLKSNIKLMDVNGSILSANRLADAFLYGWSSDSKRLIGYRDWDYFNISIDGTAIKQSMEPNYSFSEESDKRIDVSERVTYLENEDLFLWLRNEWNTRKNTGNNSLSGSIINTSRGKLLSFTKDIDTDGTMLVASPNGRYIAMIGTDSDRGVNELQIYDRENKTWTQLGKIVIHPHNDWDYIKPSWNPWFADSSKLVFISDKGILISSPDGKDKKIISKEKHNIGIPTPSPDGKMIAYVSFEPRPKKIRNDLKFYGGTTVWVIKTDENTTPKAITNKNEDETYCLRWLGNKQVVFDRIADDTFYKKSRLWKADIPQ